MKKVCQKRKLALSPRKRKVLAILIFSFLLLLIFFSTYVFYYSSTKKIYAHQYASDIKLSGLSKNNAKDLLLKRSNAFLEEDIVLEYEDKVYVIKPDEIGLTYDADKTVEEVWQVGRKESFTRSFWELLSSLFEDNRQDFVFSYDNNALSEKIAKIKKELEDSPQDYEIVYQDSGFQLLEERKDGTVVDEESLLSDLTEKLGFLSADKIIINLNSIKPQISKSEADKTLNTANNVINQDDIKLLFKNQSFDLDKDTIAGFLSFSQNEDKIKMAIIDDRISIFTDSIGKAIDVEPTNAVLTYANDKVNVVTSSKNGQKLNKTQARLDIKSLLQSRINQETTDNKLNLQVEILAPEITDNDIERLGIKELIGSGTTNFYGSPTNRIHNITVGAQKLSNIILKPGEEFSTIKRLGDIDAEAGYLPELVIKEDRTMPEFGGGLCQVSSTLFRAVLNAGLKVTERKNHKYRVSYYEPPIGMDASIYDPSPDLKFTNNYDNYILIQSKIEGKKITYEIFGSKDGRIVSISEPVTSDFVDPGPAIYVETDTLNVGEQKRIEKKAIGLTAKFNYEVKRGEKVLQSKTFVSKYVPWPEKWLVGTKPVESQPEVLPTETTIAQ